MTAYFEEKSHSDGAHLAGSVITPENKQTLRAEAVKARQLLKKARRLAASSKVLTPWEASLVRRPWVRGTGAHSS